MDENENKITDVLKDATAVVEDILQSVFRVRDLKGDSKKWANWQSMLSPHTCGDCAEKHGTIFDISAVRLYTCPELHANCQCIYVPMRTVVSGKVTDMGEGGADVFLRLFKRLPDYYVSKEQAYEAGWKKHHKKLCDVLPGKMIGGAIFFDDYHKLPTAPERIWYEADFNYHSGKRNNYRIIYSNDGLIFVTYDHYNTFYELIEETPCVEERQNTR